MHCPPEAAGVHLQENMYCCGTCVSQCEVHANLFGLFFTAMSEAPAALRSWPWSCADLAPHRAYTCRFSSLY